MVKNISKHLLIVATLYLTYYLSLYFFLEDEAIGFKSFMTYLKYYPLRPDKLYALSLKVLKDLPAKDKWIYLGMHTQAIGVSGIVGVLIIAIDKHYQSKDIHGAFGNSHFATYKEAKKAGYFDPSNFVLGIAYDKFIGNCNKTHILIMAPTQSYKTTGMVIPTMLHCQRSMIVNDMKNEIYTLTSGYRKEVLGQDIIYFNPTDLHSRCYNPLDFIRKNTDHEIGDTQLVANNLIDEEDNNDTYWVKEARAMLVALIVHVLHEKDLDPTLGQIRELINNPTTSADDLLEELTFSPRNIVAQIAAGFLNKSDRDRSGCLSTLKSFLNLWADPIISKITSKSEFNFRDFSKNGKNTTLYICTPPDDINRVKQLQRLLWAQAIKSFMSKEIKEEVVLMLDEFPALGRIDDFEEQIAYIAGYGMSAVIICQDLKQLEATYKKSDSIINNCKIKVSGASNDERTAERISKWAGITTANPKSNSRSGTIFSLVYFGRQQSQGEAPRPLINFGEIMQLSEYELIVFKEGTFPVLAKKAPYFKYKKWIEHTKITPAPGREQKIIIDPQTDQQRTARIIKRRYNFNESIEMIHKNISEYTIEQIIPALKIFDDKIINSKKNEPPGIPYLYGILKNTGQEFEGVNKVKQSKLFPIIKKAKGGE